MPRLTFITGGARSGKSAYAEGLAERARLPVLYVATAQALDDEMRGRIAAHRMRRPEAWRTIELPSGVGMRLLAEPPREEKTIVLDCLTLLVSNVLLQAVRDPDHPSEAEGRAAVEHEVVMLLKAIERIPAVWIVVSNEVGQGVVPAYALGRLFRDLLGWANRQLGEQADDVFWMVAGIPVPIGQHRDPRGHFSRG